MKMTLAQVKEDIKSGKSKGIYYSKYTLWWTHLTSDLPSAAEVGKKCQEAGLKKLLKLCDPLPPIEQKRFDMMVQRLKDNPDNMDSSGAPLYHMFDPMKWIENCEGWPEFFGKHKLDALMKAHHQNCENRCFKKWKDYNDFIDGIDPKAKKKLTKLTFED